MLIDVSVKFIKLFHSKQKKKKKKKQNKK